ncbi:tetratricopeptide repeat protein 33 isoform X2 [Capsicum annuum]|uniref:tetratricopeptide repeat protein 33 isoform X2 n=1 Tax=Capsicum annuum TaxID=4072 RepID=UPI0007BEFB1A|nr:tetratricopeptide repeat protein 33 isoform X2 [Capsicum annuum]
MKMTWKNQKKKLNKRCVSLFEDENPTHNSKEKVAVSHSDGDDDTMKLVESFQEQGNKLAEEGKYREALGKWESALLLMPDRAILHEQKAQILLELGETWKALKAATRATELEPSWDEAWVTLGRAQLNYGEPDSAIESLDRALAIKILRRRVMIDKLPCIIFSGENSYRHQA